MRLGNTRQVITDPMSIRRGLTIPLPRGKALRIGFTFKGWFRLGPRKYDVVIPPNVLQEMRDFLGDEKTDKILKDFIARVEADPYAGEPVDL